jgi:hypothetical protein
VTDREIDEALKKAAQTPHAVEPALIGHIADSIKSSLRRVRPLPPTRILTSGLALICVAVALAGAARAGFYGIEKMSLLQRALIFPVLVVLVWVAGTESVNAMIPGSRRRLSPAALLGMSIVVLVGVFALLFHDYRTEHFVSAGVVCLLTGFLHAVPAALLCWLVLRRGFAVNSVSAGLVAGTLAGLAGVGVLELHCANFQATHVLVWHTAVVPLSGTAAALVASALRFREGSCAHGRSVHSPVN